MDSKQVFIVLISIFLLAVAQNSSKDTGAAKEEDYVLVPDNPSPCLRPCRKDTPPMECRYKFIVENYQSLGRACHDCPRNQTDCLRPHCVPAEGTSRTVVTVNRNMPGPAIQVCLGDRIKVLVENHMAVEETSIHWHGLHQRNTPYMDGVPFVTQCPIPTGTSFEYSFVAEQIGTWVWHSHSGNQRGDGLYGALIVRQPYDNDFHNKLYDYDQPEHLMVVTDWTQTPVHELYVNNFITGSLIPLTTILVNGVGYFYDSTSKAGIPPPRFHVQKGFRYRFRLINPEFMMCPIEVSVDNHTMTVISMDGMDNEPITVSSFVSYSGERFDFVINADQEIDNYWIRFRGAVICGITKAHQVAVLTYNGADKSALPAGEPTHEYRREDGLELNSVNAEILKDNSISIPELNATQEDDETLKETPDTKFYINFDFYNVSNTNFFHPDYYDYNESNPRFNSKTPQLNHITLAFPSFPLLTQRDEIMPEMFCNASTVRNCTKEFCQCTHVLQVPLNDVVELVLIDEGNVGDPNHPYHLHGHSFRVIGMERLGDSADVETVKTMDKLGLLQRKLHKAPWKDTVTVPNGGYTIIRFKATNPGYWLFHCHIDFHATAGMGLVFKVGEHQDMIPVPKNFPKCGNWKLT